MKTLIITFRKRMTAGLLVVVPVGVTALVLRLAYRFTAGILTPAVRGLSGGLPEYAVSLLSVLVLVMLLYLIGVMTANLLGRRLFAWGERLVERLPIAGVIYSATRQLIQAVGAPDHTALKSVVMVEFPRQGSYAIGFVTGTIIYDQDRELAKVIIPTSPNPTTGFFELIPVDQLRELDLSVEDAIKLVASAGIIAPDRLARQASRAMGLQSPEEAEQRTYNGSSGHREKSDSRAV